MRQACSQRTRLTGWVGDWQALGRRVGDNPVEGIFPEGVHHHVGLDAELLLQGVKPDHHGLITVCLQDSTGTARLWTDVQLVIQQLLAWVTARGEPECGGLEEHRPLVVIPQVVVNVEMHSPSSTAKSNSTVQQDRKWVMGVPSPQAQASCFGSTCLKWGQ